MRYLNTESLIQRNPVLRRLIQPKQIPLLFSVTIVAGIFYHYAPKLTWFWIIASLVIQGLLFKLFDFVKKRPLIGGICYIVTGIAFLALSFGLIRLGTATPPFAPDDPYKQLDFLVWFLTPQSVLTTGSYDANNAQVISNMMQTFSTEYLGYTLALFTLFTMFVATTAYYFTLVRYRVLMSFVVMIFPFAIYAKENETMPVLSIIILLVCYFAVMIYCRQAHGEDSAVVQKYEPDAVSRLSMPDKKSPYAKVKPEFLDGAFFKATGIFIAGATILVMVLPKPEVEADRSLFDSAMEASALSDMLMDAISAFTDSSDGGTYSNMDYQRTLFYAQANEPLNLRIRTFSDYHYDNDTWNASDFDGKPLQNDMGYIQMDGYKTMADTVDPAQIATAVQQLAKQDAEFAKTYGLEGLSELPDENADAYYLPLTVRSATNGKFSAYPAPLHIRSAEIHKRYNDITEGYMNKSGVMFTYSTPMLLGETYTLEYLSERFANTDAAQTLMRSTDQQTWPHLLEDAVQRTADDEKLNEIFLNAYTACGEAFAYEIHCDLAGETPDRVRDLAFQLTEGLDSDYEKAMAIRDYLRFSDDFVYSLDWNKSQTDNVETFLFNNKIGVCYQYASAMTEMCRAVGLPVRYVEGYSMSEEDRRLNAGEFNYAITTEHGHAFVDVYISGYGWMMFDATSGNVISQAKTESNVLAALQYSGLILFGVILVLLILLKWLIPYLSEKLFRRKFRNHPDAETVTAAFARLRKQWRADPAKTARVLCREQSEFLQIDLQPLLECFETAVYAGHCDAKAAERAYPVYCAAHDAWKSACKRNRKAERSAVVSVSAS